MALNAKNNPFSPNGIVSKSLFGGREEYIFKILKKLHNIKGGKTASFYLYGERGIGKTALAKLISYVSLLNDDQFLKLKFLTSYYCVQQNQSIRSVLESSVNIIADKLEEGLLQTIGNKIGNIFKNGKFSIGVQGAGASYEYMDKSQKENYESTIKDNFILIARRIINEIKNKSGEDHYDGLLFIIDEMDNLSELSMLAPIIRGITTTLDFEDLGNISFLFIGYHEGYEKFVQADVSIKRHIDGVHLKEMPDEEIVETFEKGFKEAGVTWDDHHLKNKTYLTGGYPFAIQVIGYHLVEVDQDNHIDETDWKECILPSSRELQEKEYSTFYSFDQTNKSNRDKIQLILATANDSGINELSLKDIEKYSKVKNPGQYIKKLMLDGIVLQNKDSKKYSIKRGLFPVCIILDKFHQIMNDQEEINKYIKLIDEMRSHLEVQDDKNEKV